MTTEKEVRSERIAIKVTPQVHAELSRLAAEVGQSPATLASVYLGEAINKKRIERENNQRMADSVGIAFKEMFEPFMNAMEKAAAEQLPEEK
ncbi:hypothetical protein J3369_21955 [Alteromonas sp. NFXS44]|uniref:hypothetical protein n=1 Tax=Alteromonas sp. NFXS44 TaxID=2818435 RepID=UPI0032DF6C40